MGLSLGLLCYATPKKHARMKGINRAKKDGVEQYAPRVAMTTERRIQRTIISYLDHVISACE